MNEEAIIAAFEAAFGVKARAKEYVGNRFLNPVIDSAFRRCVCGKVCVGNAIYEVLYCDCLAITNLTQHAATDEQKEAGVIDLEEADREDLLCALTFDELPTQEEIAARARKIARIAKRNVGKRAMIGGASYLMPALEQELRRVGVQPLYAFSKRVSSDQVQPDGSVKKVSVFKFEGFVGA